MFLLDTRPFKKMKNLPKQLFKNKAEQEENTDEKDSVQDEQPSTAKKPSINRKQYLDQLCG